MSAVIDYYNDFHNRKQKGEIDAKMRPLKFSEFTKPENNAELERLNNFLNDYIIELLTGDQHPKFCLAPANCGNLSTHLFSLAWVQI